MSDTPKKFDIKDTKRILLGWPPKIAYDGNVDEVVAFYSKASGQTQDRTSLFKGKKLTSIFIYAMCLGKNAGLFSDYEKKDGKLDRRATIDVEYFASQPEYVWMMIATAFDHAKNVDDMKSDELLELFDNPAKIVEICEKYANYGIHQLMKMNDQASVGDPYRGYDEKLSDLLDEP
jgi:hypothetical protein